MTPHGKAEVERISTDLPAGGWGRRPALSLQFDILHRVTSVTALRRHRLRSCGLEEAPGLLPPATVESPVTGRRVRQVQRAAFLHSVQVDHGIERLSRIRDHVEGPVHNRRTQRRPMKRYAGRC